GPATVATSGGVVCPATWNLQNPLSCQSFVPNATVTIIYTRQANGITIPVGQNSDFVNTACVRPAQQQNPLACAQETVTVMAAEEEAPDLAVTINSDDQCVPPSIEEPQPVPSLVRYDLLWENLGNVDMDQSRVVVDCAE